MTVTKSSYGRKGFIWLLHDSPSGKAKAELRAGTERQELKWRPWRKAVHWSVLHSFISLLSNKPQDYLPRPGTTHINH